MNLRSKGGPEFPLDLELEKTLRELRFPNLPIVDLLKDFESEAEMESGRNQGESSGTQQPLRARQLIKDISSPGPYHMSGGIRQPDNPPNFQIHPHYFGLVKADPFTGRSSECPLEHLDKFMENCQGAVTHNVDPEYVYMTLFRHSLIGQAKAWFNDLEPGSLQTWDEVVKEFLRKYYPPWKTTEARKKIASFEQEPDETLGEARERFRYMLRRCPHHGYDTGLRVSFFYDGLNPISRQNLDAGVGGQVARIPVDEAEAIIDDVCRNYSWEGKSSQRQAQKSAKLDDESFLRKLMQESVEKALVKNKLASESANAVTPFYCNFCSGTNHDSSYCGGRMSEANFEKSESSPVQINALGGGGSRPPMQEEGRGSGNSYWRGEPNRQRDQGGDLLKRKKNREKRRGRKELGCEVAD